MAGLLMLAGSKALGKRRAVPLALAGIVLYTLLVGADAAVVRAAIMGCLYVLALYFGRQTEVRTSLIFSALLMTAINPHTLWDVGFQLSFAATAGLIWVTPPLEHVADRWLAALVGTQHVRRVMGLLSEALLVTLAAQIATEPLIVYHFGRMSAVSLLTNLLILPVQPMVMLAGGLATLAGMVWLPLGQLLGWPGCPWPGRYGWWVGRRVSPSLRSAWGASAPGCWRRFTPGWWAGCGWPAARVPKLRQRHHHPQAPTACGARRGPCSPGDPWPWR